ncbi:MAG TPA: ABC transporter ATP-binding protein [Acidimicrobiales bacterium]|nr:ABC transporter ATP-binding protein [Acidimicrobiales bacterium]
MAIDVRDLSHGYDTPRGWLRVLDRVTLSLPAGGYGAVTGSSGAGKTTLLAVLGGLERPDEGDVRVGGHDVARLAGDDLAAYRRTTVGFVFQHFGLLDALTAAENVELACTLAGVPPSRRRARAGELLDAVGLSARARHRPPALSGGERQRVAIARAMANSPALVLADEPTGNLDTESAERVVNLLEELRREHGCTLVVVTHSAELAARAQDRFALERGALAEPAR